MILAIETSSPKASVAVWDESSQAILWDESFVTDRSHNSVIFKYLTQALEVCGDDLDLIAIGNGPGSYSGVRVGIAAANGISIAKNCKVISVSSLEAYSSSTGESYYVVGDARRKSYFIAEINEGNLLGEPELVDLATFKQKINNIDLPIFSMDESVVNNFNQAMLNYPSAELIARRANQLKSAGVEEVCKAIEPHYLRPPYITKAKEKPVPGFPGRKR